MRSGSRRSTNNRLNKSVRALSIKARDSALQSDRDQLSNAISKMRMSNQRSRLGNHEGSKAKASEKDLMS